MVLVWGIEAGRVRRERPGGRLSFVYDESWREGAGSVPLSLSLPLGARQHGHDAVDAFLWGLLPDNERVLDRWAQRFQVSARDAFALLSEVGEDCPGAVQFAAPDRVDELRGEGELDVEWLDEEDVARRLRTLREDQAAWRLAEDQGQFSLAGSQPKTALVFLDGRWGVPAGRTPTTHILKPPLRGFDGYVENEHLCLVLAREAGLAAATSQVQRFGDEAAIVVERYDRARTASLAEAAAAEAGMRAASAAAGAAGTASDARAAATAASAAAAREESLRALARTQPILRLHQEDLCQALGVRPTLKYQNQGGPGPSDVMGLIREHSSSPGEDAEAFVDALTFNWLIGGTDAHAKNYSLLHGAGRRVRLAPLYDLSSFLPYAPSDGRRVKLAMKIGSKYGLRDIRKRHWISLAEEAGLDPDGTVARMVRLASAVGDTVPEVRRRATDDGLNHPIVGRLLKLIEDRVRASCTLLAGL